jgi:hypothetical protein
MKWFKMNTDNHTYIHVNITTIVFSLLKKICQKKSFSKSASQPKNLYTVELQRDYTQKNIWHFV